VRHHHHHYHHHFICQRVISTGYSTTV